MVRIISTQFLPTDAQLSEWDVPVKWEPTPTQSNEEGLPLTEITVETYQLDESTTLESEDVL